MTKTADQITTALELPAHHVAPLISQATSIEQSRAVAEVRAMVLISKGSPRDEQDCLKQMRLSCGLMTMAEHAFYKYSRGGETVTGPTIGLARELARCWGNLTHGISELARNDEAGESEMLAFAWDLERNVRPSITFIVPHRRDRSEAKGGQVQLTSMRDIYENNTNQGARRLREMILAALPVWYVEEAKDACQKTLQRGDGKPLPERIAAMVAAFAELGIVVERIEAKLGVGSKAFSALDLARLAVSYRSIKREELSAAEEFPELTAGKIQKSLEEPVSNGQPKATAKSAEPDRTDGGPSEGVLPKRRGRPPKAKPDATGGDADSGPAKGSGGPAAAAGGQGATLAQDRPAIPASSGEPAGNGIGEQGQARLDLNDPNAPDADDEPEAFIRYFITRKLALITDPASLALETMDKTIKSKFRGMTSLLKLWSDAVERRVAKLNSQQG